MLAGGNGDAQPPVGVPVAFTVAENIARCACIILVVLPLGVGRVELRTRGARWTYFGLSAAALTVYCATWVPYLHTPTFVTGLELALLPAVMFISCSAALRHHLLTAVGLLFAAAHIWITALAHNGLAS